MNLIEEIEADAKLVQDFHDERERVNPNDGTWNNCGKEAEAWTLVQYEWWPRIKAALLAAQEMDKHLDKLGVVFDPEEAQRKFREAME